MFLRVSRLGTCVSPCARAHMVKDGSALEGAGTLGEAADRLWHRRSSCLPWHLPALITYTLDSFHNSENRAPQGGDPLRYVLLLAGALRPDAASWFSMLSRGVGPRLLQACPHWFGRCLRLGPAHPKPPPRSSAARRRSRSEA